MKRAALILCCAGILAMFLVSRRETAALPSAEAARATQSPADNRQIIRFVKNPDPVPEFTLQDLDGKTISTASMHGEVFLLNFWATWCGPCRAEIPDLIELQNKYAGRLQIIGLSVDEVPAEAVKRFVQKSRINYRVAIAPAEVQAKFGGILALPTSFVMDTEGRIVQKHVGLRNPALYETEIRALLGLPVEARIETFEDTGQVLLTNAKRATEIPGLDLAKLTPDQKKIALRRLNARNCSCGCGLTLAQCRINDTTCTVSLATAQHMVREIMRGQTFAAPAPAKR